MGPLSHRTTVPGVVPHLRLYCFIRSVFINVSHCYFRQRTKQIQTLVPLELTHWWESGAEVGQAKYRKENLGIVDT